MSQAIRSVPPVTRTRKLYRCDACSAETAKWTGWCDACGASGSLSETRPAVAHDGSGRAAPAVPAVPITEAVSDGPRPLPTGIAEVDRVLGGGLVPGSVTVVGGEPGIGKSTLLLQVGAAVAATSGRRRSQPDAPTPDAEPASTAQAHRCLYVTAEESVQQVAARAERLDALAPGLWLAAETNLDCVLGLLDDVRPDVVVVDSVQALSDPALGSPAGTLSQVRSCAQVLVTEAKRRGVALVVVGHVTKEGGLAGPKVLEHVVDTVLSFEGERHHALRLLRATKHRFGGTHELGLFEMGDKGLTGVPDPSALFLADRQPGIPGSVVAPVLDGHRPLLVEVQALVVPSQAPLPRRTAQGVDSGRLAQVLAVLERRAGLGLSRMEVHVAVTGGVRVREPGVDLAVALAVASSLVELPVPRALVACGEVGLGGELRQVHRTDRRLAETARLGFGIALVPVSAPDPPPGLQVGRVRSLCDALAGARLTS
jgi:DNA repair protein RadA/Sms